MSYIKQQQQQRQQRQQDSIKGRNCNNMHWDNYFFLFSPFPIFVLILFFFPLTKS